MVGRSVGPYRLVRRLGAGGMGEVFLADDTRLNRQVAIKQLVEADDAPSDSRGRLLREARAAAALNHPNIATLHDVVDVDGRTYLVMEFVEGETLAARVARGPLGIDEAVDIGRQLATALDAAHARGIVHRDLKPANICLTLAGAVKILDFGLARRATPSAAIAHTTVTHDTLHGQTAGTPGYMAPEQVLGQATDPRTDLYAAGVILYELLSGRRPYVGPDTLAVAVATVSTDPPPMATVNPGIPPALAAVVSRAMARDKAARFQTARELGEALASWRTTSDTQSTVPDVVPVSELRPKPAGAHRLTAARATAIVVSGLAVAALAAWWWSAAPVGGARDVDETPVVAILPFLTEAGDVGTDALATGFADVLVATLSKLPELGVISPALTREFRSADRNPPRIAQSLGATLVVDASMQRLGDRLRVTLTVLRPGSDLVAWSDQVDGTLDDIFDMQRKLAQGLASGLRVRLSPESRVALDATPTLDRGAFTDYARGRALLDRPDVPGNVDAAIEAFRAAVERDKAFALAHAGLAEGYWARYDATRDTAWVPLALAAVEQAVTLDPASPRVVLAAGRLYAGTGRIDEAVNAYRRTIALQPHDDEPYRLLGRAFERAGRADEAREAYERAIRMRPGSWHNHSELGAFHFGAGRYHEAAAAFERVVELAPDHAWGFVNLGASLHAAGDRTRAIEYYRRATALADLETAHSNIGTLLYQEGRYDEAREAFIRAIALAPRRATYHRNLGDALRKLGRTGDAQASFERAAALAAEQLAVDPGNAQQLAFLAVMEAKLGRFVDALAHAREAVALAPAAADVRYRLGVVQTLAGAHAEALTTLSEAIDLGYSLTLLRADDDLAPLGDDPLFTRLTTDAAHSKEDP